MIHRQDVAGLETDLFTYIYFERIYDMVKDFNIHRCALDFDILFLGLLSKGKIKLNKNYLSIIYNSPRSQDSVMYLYPEDLHK